MPQGPIIAIGRQFGSGGREIGRLLAGRLNIPFYDKEILKKAAEASGISPEMFEEGDEKPASSLIYSLSVGSYDRSALFSDYSKKADRDTVFKWQSDTIRRLAAEGPCVIIGRCAGHLLRAVPGLVSVYVHAPLEARIQRISRLHNIDEDAARALIRKTDKTRANYYSFYTDREWDAAAGYDLCLDSDKLGVEGAAEVILAFCQNRRSR